MKECSNVCKRLNTECPNEECRYWINAGEVKNCTFIAIENNGEMDLKTVGEFLNLSFVRIKQIQDAAMIKINKSLRVLQ